MSHLIEVAFRGNRKEFFLWDGDDPPKPPAAVIVDGDRGEDLGRVHATGELAAKRYAGVAHGSATLGDDARGVTRRALRLAGDDDVRRDEELDAQNEAARRKAMERVKAHGLVMKVSDAEWQWDRRKLTFYFTAEKRVDFRNLVRDLAATFRTRIELKQIGVRDEAKRLSGIGRCGREYCSASWLPELRPVNLSVAKDQRLSLNPTQISGACGRLMCSLRYEHEFYVQSRKRFPKEGKILVTARGEEKVVANDIFHDRVTLRNAEGETRLVELALLKRELAALALERPGELPPLELSDADLADAAAGDASAEDAPEGRRHDGDGRLPGTPRGARPRERAPEPPTRSERVEYGTLEGTRRVAPPAPAAPPGPWTSPSAPTSTMPPAGDDAPPSLPALPAVVGPPAATPATPAVLRDASADDASGDEADDDGDETADDATAAAEGDGQPRRRRRGRRGGRRARHRNNPGGAPPPESDAPATET